jgi:hypothetical protein
MKKSPPSQTEKMKKALVAVSRFILLLNATEIQESPKKVLIKVNPNFINPACRV